MTQAKKHSWLFAACLSLIATACLGLLIILSAAYLGKQLNEVTSSTAAKELNLELERTIQSLEDLNYSSNVCSRQVVEGLRELVASSRYIRSATLLGKAPIRCSDHKTFVTPDRNITLSWDVYSLQLDALTIRDTLALPLWFTLMVEDIPPFLQAPSFWPIQKKALLRTQGHMGIYIALAPKAIVAISVGIVLCCVMVLLLVYVQQPNKSADTRLIKRLLKNDQINIQYQPIVDMKTGRWMGAEALLRCSDPSTDTYYPAPYIVDIAEKNHAAPQLTHDICRKVAADYHNYFWALEEFYISINLNGHDLRDPLLALHLQQIFDEFNVPVKTIILEVTETILVADEVSIDNIFHLKKMGFRIALDDFGTGYCGLQYLEKFPVDFIKLDASFIQSGNSKMVPYAAGLSKLNKVKVIAEGVETKDQVDALLSEGIWLGQGWYYAAAMPAPKFVREYYTKDQRDSVLLSVL